MTDIDAYTTRLLKRRMLGTTIFKAEQQERRAMTEPTLPTDTDAVRAEKLDAQNVRLLKRIVDADAEVVALRRENNAWRDKGADALEYVVAVQNQELREAIRKAPHAVSCPNASDLVGHCECWKSKVIL